MDDLYFDEEEGRISPLSLLFGAIATALAGLVIYNVVWLQAGVAGQMQAMAKASGVIEIDAKGNTQEVIPATSAKVEVAGSPLPKPAALKADPLIASIQRELILAGLMNGPADGVPGQALRDAIAGWQTKNHQPVTGAANQQLLETLIYERQIREAQNFVPDETATTTAAEPVAAEPAAQPAPATKQATKQASDESSVAQIRLMQRGLARLGYRPGPVTGTLSAETQSAIRAYEKDRGLKLTGKPSKALMAELTELFAQGQ